MRLGTLSPEEQTIEERIRTLSQALCGAGVVGAALYFLRSVLVPLIMAIGLKYLLQPVVALLTLRPLTCCGSTCCRNPPRLRGVPQCLQPLFRSVLQLRLPHVLAVCVALGVAFGILALLGFVVVDSVHVFSSHAGMYSERVVEIGTNILGWMDTMQDKLGITNHTAIMEAANGTDPAMSDIARMRAMAGKVPLTSLILSVLSSMMEALSNLLLVLLFTVYLLLTSPPVAVDADADGVHAQADAQINSYIRGKVAISLLVGALSAVALLALGVDLWLVFGCLAFWLNFVPNVGTAVAVMLPMPLVLLDPKFSSGAAALALILPLSVHGFAGNVLEPMLFGHSLKLHPVVILLALLLWGSVWGITGMVLAVPITAVARIRLAHVNHPLPQYVAALLVGGGVAADVDDKSSSSSTCVLTTSTGGGVPTSLASALQRGKARDHEASDRPLIGAMEAGAGVEPDMRPAGLPMAAADEGAERGAGGKADAAASGVQLVRIDGA